MEIDNARCSFCVPSNSSIVDTESVHTRIKSQQDWQDICKRIEKKDDAETQAVALESIMISLFNGDNVPANALVTVIKYCLHSQDHRIKKLLYLFFEIAEKKDKSTGKLKPEMLLVCEYLRQELIHPNEYIRGSVSRFIAKIKDAEVLQPLVPSIFDNLTHPHPYVRKYACLCVWKVVEVDIELIPEADEKVQQLLEAEANEEVRRNLFLILCHLNFEKAIYFFQLRIDEVLRYGDAFQLQVLQLARKACKKYPALKPQFFRVIFAMLESDSAAVAYGAAQAIVSLSSSPSAMKAAARCYVQLLVHAADNNIKLVVLNRIAMLQQVVFYRRVMEELVMDMLRALSNPNIMIRQKVLKLVLGLVSETNVKDITSYLRKEIKQHSLTNEGSLSTTIRRKHHKLSASETAEVKYRHLLIRSIHECAVKFPSIVASVLDILLDFIASDGAMDVVLFIRDIVDSYPEMRQPIMNRMFSAIEDVKSGKVYRVILWIFGQYCSTSSGKDIEAVFTSIKDVLGKPDYVEKILAALQREQQANGGGDPAADNPEGSTVPQTEIRMKTVILEDGTYGTQMVETKESKTADSLNEEDEGRIMSLRKLILKGDFLLASVTASTLFKLVLKASQLSSAAGRGGWSDPWVKGLQIEAMLYMCAFVQLAQVGVSAGSNATPASHTSFFNPSMNGNSNQNGKRRFKDPDCVSQINTLLYFLLNAPTLLYNESKIRTAFTEQTQNAFAAMIHEKEQEEDEEDENMQESKGGSEGLRRRSKKGKDGQLESQPEDQISFRHLKKAGSKGLDEDMDEDVARAVASITSGEGSNTKGSSFDGSGSGSSGEKTQLLDKVYQLTGFADPILAEATVHLHDLQIIIEIIMTNQTQATLTNLSLELITTGDLTVVDKGTKYTLAPFESKTISTSLRVSSTESGRIFGNIVYEESSRAGTHVLNLDEIHLDIMDYIKPATCSQVAFRSMWAEFEWENKVAVNTEIAEIQTYLSHIGNITNTKTLTKSPALAGNSNFLAANLYARSIFGEDALINVSVERQIRGKIVGYIRIRAKTQGIALSLGDRITAQQRHVS